LTDFLAVSYTTTDKPQSIVSTDISSLTTSMPTGSEGMPRLDEMQLRPPGKLKTTERSRQGSHLLIF
jgi:hypothetical protein